MLTPELPILTGEQVKDTKGFMIVLIAVVIAILIAVALQIIEHVKRRSK